jgi:hypothetical protein
VSTATSSARLWPQHSAPCHAHVTASAVLAEALEKVAKAHGFEPEESAGLDISDLEGASGGATPPTSLEDGKRLLPIVFKVKRGE